MKKLRSFHEYSWYPVLIVIVVFVSLMIAYGIRFSFSVFYLSLVEEFNWNKAHLSGVFSLFILISGSIAPLIGFSVDKYGPKKIIIAGITIFSISLVGLSSINSLWQFYLLFGILSSLGFSGISVVPYSATISRWFVKKRGLPTGFAFSGIGMGALFVVPIAQFLTIHLGWRVTFLCIGISSILIILSLTLLFIDFRSDEREVLAPHSSPFHMLKTDLNGSKGGEIWTAKDVLSSLPFWCFLVGAIFAPIGNMFVLAHQVPYLVNLGVSKMWASSILGIMGVFSTGGRILLGLVYDFFGKVTSTLSTFLCSILGILSLFLFEFFGSAFFIYGYVVLFGLGFGTRSSIFSAMSADLFPGKSYSSIFGYMILAEGLGGALGPLIGGYVIEKTNSYDLAFHFSILFNVIGCILIVFAITKIMRNKRYVAKQCF